MGLEQNLVFSCMTQNLRVVWNELLFPLISV